MRKSRFQIFNNFFEKLSKMSISYNIDWETSQLRKTNIVLCTNILKSKDELTNEELMFFLTGGVGLENTKPNPAPAWLSDKSWDEICRMSDLSTFSGFLPDFVERTNEWQVVYNHITPYSCPIPGTNFYHTI